MKAKLITSAEWLFLVGVALLIVRKNTYPWPIKRASDILFLASLFTVLFFLARSGTIREFLGFTKRALFGLLLIWSGLAIATLSAYFTEGIGVDISGILAFGRFVEVGAIVLLVGFFERRDPVFHKKVALAQLSTLVYIPMLFSPQDTQETFMGRFQIFENWPSNVSYYLIVSICLVLVHLLYAARPFRKTAIAYYLIGAGMFGLLLWTQSRSSWLGITVAGLVILAVSAIRHSRPPRRLLFAGLKILGGGILIVSLLIVGFLALPGSIKNAVLARVFPGIQQFAPSLKAYVFGSPPLGTAQKILKHDLDVNIGDPTRIALWKAYTQKFVAHPLGSGVNYVPVHYEGSVKGPHNTILEMLIMAGPLGFIGMICLFALGIKTVWRSLKIESDYRSSLYLLASLVGLSVAAFFDNMVTFRTLWLVLGMTIFYRPREDPGTMAARPVARTAFPQTQPPTIAISHKNKKRVNS